MVSPKIILASNSPRRRELLGLTGWIFETKPADIDENLLPGETPAEYVERLADAKARKAAADASRGRDPRALVLGADTTVADGGRILGKPDSPEEAAEMLARLAGHTHQVYTAICLMDAATGRIQKDLCTSQVPMRPYNEEEIAAYVATGDPLDKAGAYAIQHAGFHPVQGFAGCFASVMGLPLCHLARTARRLGLPELVGLPAACQAALGYNCPVSQAVLRGENAG